MMIDNVTPSYHYLESLAISMGESISEEIKNNLTFNEIKNNLTFNISDTEILKIASDGFYVRGKKVPIDENEADMVFHAFREWLTWATLMRY